MEKMQKILILFRAVNFSKRTLIAIAISLFITTGLTFLQPLLIQNITDVGMIQRNLNVIIISVSLLLIAVLSECLISIYQAQCFSDIYNEAKTSIFQRAFHKLLSLKMNYFEEISSTEIIHNIQLDVDKVTSIVDRSFVSNFMNLFRVISGVAGLWIINWKLMLVVILITPVKFFAVQVLSKRREAQSRTWIGAYRDFSSWMGDSVNGVREIKLWNLYKIKANTFSNKLSKILNVQKRGVWFDSWNHFFEIMLEWLVMGILYILGGVLIIRGELTVGGILAFLSYCNYVTAPITSVMNIRYLLSQIYPSVDRLCSFLAQEEETAMGVPTEKRFAEISFRDLSFEYEREHLILNHVDFTIKAGEKIAIVGANGSGKSTFINLLLRFITPTEGDIALDGMDIQKMDLLSYRDMFAVVSQSIYLFFDTIRNNVDLLQAADELQLNNAYAQSGVANFISGMPRGADSMIGQNGVQLSGGEQQKLAIARAIIKDAPIVILDEANSNLDKESDAYLHQIVHRDLRDKTVVMITHRRDNLNHMDHIYELVDGRLYER